MLHILFKLGNAAKPAKFVKPSSVEQSHANCTKPGSAAQPALASDGAAQPSSLPGNAEQPADKTYRRARDGGFYTQAEFHAHYGVYLGEARWQSAQDELTQWDRTADVSAIGTPRLRSAEQPAAFSHRAAQFASHQHQGADNETEHQRLLSKLLAKDLPRPRAQVVRVNAPTDDTSLPPQPPSDPTDGVVKRLREYFLKRGSAPPTKAPLRMADQQGWLRDPRSYLWVMGAKKNQSEAKQGTPLQSKA